MQASSSVLKAAPAGSPTTDTTSNPSTSSPDFATEADAEEAINLAYRTASSNGGGGLAPATLDPIGRIDANPQALLEWIQAGR